MSIIQKTIKAKPKQDFDLQAYIFWLPFFAFFGLLMLVGAGYTVDQEVVCKADSKYLTFDECRTWNANRDLELSSCNESLSLAQREKIVSLAGLRSVCDGQLSNLKKDFVRQLSGLNETIYRQEIIISTLKNIKVSGCND